MLIADEIEYKMYIYNRYGMVWFGVAEIEMRIIRSDEE